MRFTVRSDDFYPARARLIPPENDEEDLPRAYYCDFMRIEATGDRVRLSGPFGEEIVAAQIDEPGVAFLIYREFIGMTKKESTDHYFGESAELTFTCNEKQLCTQFWCCLIGDGDLGYFPNPATAPQTYTPPPPQSLHDWLLESAGDSDTDDDLDTDADSDTADDFDPDSDPDSADDFDPDSDHDTDVADQDDVATETDPPTRG